MNSLQTRRQWVASRLVYHRDRRGKPTEHTAACGGTVVEFNTIGWGYALEIGLRRRQPRIRNAAPIMARGTTGIENIKELLMPPARSEGFGVVEEFAIALNDDSIPMTVATRHSPANSSEAAPSKTIHRVPRVLDVGSKAVPVS